MIRAGELFIKESLPIFNIVIGHTGDTKDFPGISLSGIELGPEIRAGEGRHRRVLHLSQVTEQDITLSSSLVPISRQFTSLNIAHPRSSEMGSALFTDPSSCSNTY